MKIEYDAEFSKFGTCICCGTQNSVNNKRYCRECEERFQEIQRVKYNKPPIGLVTHDVWIAQRIEDIISAMNRYIQDNREVPIEWLNEYNKLIVEIK